MESTLEVGIRQPHRMGQRAAPAVTVPPAHRCSSRDTPANHVPFNDEPRQDLSKRAMNISALNPKAIIP
jgi:hypothetical protein